MPSSSFAKSDHFSDLTNLVGQSDLVFHGTVVSVDYKESLATAEQSALPHTFVTYKIQQILNGSYQGDTLTLRFLGGVHADNPDLVMTVSTVPLFEAGDEDVLFVSRNTEVGCPLVGCAGGRLRVVDNKVYSNSGLGVLEAKDANSLSFDNKPNQHKKFKERTIGTHKITYVSSPDAANNDELKNKPTPSAAVSTLPALLAKFKQVQKANTRSQVDVKTAEVAQVFSVPNLRAKGWGSSNTSAPAVSGGVK